MVLFNVTVVCGVGVSPDMTPFHYRVALANRKKSKASALRNKVSGISCVLTFREPLYNHLKGEGNGEEEPLCDPVPSDN